MSDLSTGILGFWKFEDDYDDFFEVGPTLNPTGAPTFETTSPHINKFAAVGAYLGAGAGANIRDLDSTVFDLEGVDRTFAVWFYVTVLTGQPPIMDVWANDSGLVQWLLWFDTETTLTFQVRDAGNADHAIAVTAPAINGWHLAVVTRKDSTGALTLSLDAGTRATGTSATAKSGVADFSLGARNNGGAVMSGGVDSLAAWDRVLTTGDEATLFNAGAGTDPPFAAAPVADFHADRVEAGVGNDFVFTDDSTNIPTSWLWDFGDETTSTDQNPTHSYAELGTYSVSLTATNDIGADAETKTDYIDVVVPTIVPILVDPDTGDYESMSELSADAQDLVAANEQWEVTCATFFDDTTANFDGWNTDGTRYPRIAPEEPHLSTGDVTELSYLFHGNLTVDDIGASGFIIFEGIQVQGDVSLQSGVAWVGGCVLKGNVTFGCQLAMWNCVVLGNLTASDGPFGVWDCTVIGGINGDDTVNSSLLNDYALAYSGLTGVLVTQCASEDSTGSIGLTGVSHADGTAFVSATDLRLTEASPLRDVGADRDAMPPLDFSDDINGEDRPDDDGLEDIGAFEQFVSQANWPDSMWLVKKGKSLSSGDGRDTALVTADDADLAEELLVALFPNENWEGATSSQVSSPASAGWWGWTFRVGTGGEDAFEVSYVGQEDDSLEDVIAGLSDLIVGSSTGVRRLIVAATGSGDKSLRCSATPPEAAKPLDSVILRLNHLGDPGDELSVLFSNVSKVPKVVEELT